jgi:hypothetical protein
VFRKSTASTSIRAGRFEDTVQRHVGTAIDSTNIQKAKKEISRGGHVQRSGRGPLAVDHTPHGAVERGHISTSEQQICGGGYVASASVDFASFLTKRRGQQGLLNIPPTPHERTSAYLFSIDHQGGD